MFLNYFALGSADLRLSGDFFGIIAIHDIPYLIAKKRNHPHADAIHTAGWVSLFSACYLAVSVDLGDALSTGRG